MKASLFLLLLVISSNGFSEDGTHDGDYCEGKDAECDEGYQWLSKAWLVQNFPHTDKLTGECAPCKTNEKTVVVPAKNAPDWLLKNNDWTKEPWTETDPDLNFYGIVWANGSYGELFGLGACRFQSSWQKHKVCDATQMCMGLEEQAQKSIMLFGLQIPETAAIYTAVDERMIEFIGVVDKWYGFAYLTDFFRRFLGVYSYITIDDIKKDPNAWMQHWINTPTYTHNGKKHVGFTGPYYKIIDSNGKKTEYFKEYLKYSKGRLYTFNRSNNIPAVDVDTRVLIWKIILTIMVGALGALVYYCLMKTNVLQAPKVHKTDPNEAET